MSSKEEKSKETTRDARLTPSQKATFSSLLTNRGRRQETPVGAFNVTPASSREGERRRHGQHPRSASENHKPSQQEEDNVDYSLSKVSAAAAGPIHATFDAYNKKGRKRQVEQTVALESSENDEFSTGLGP